MGMPRRPPTTAADLVMLLAPLALLGAACDGPGNSGIFMPDPDLVRVVPWMSGTTPAVENNGSPAAVGPLLPVYPPIGLGLPDPGSQKFDCAPLAGLAFSTGWFDHFEPHEADGGTTGVAPGWSSYDDLSKYSFHVPGDYTWYPSLKGTTAVAWGMPAERFAGPSCDGKPNNWVLHFRGGLFRDWGGGISHAFMDPVSTYRDDIFSPCKHNEDFCPEPMPMGAKVDRAGMPAFAHDQDGNEIALAQYHDFVDVDGKYEGVAFWARRGPEGHDRVVVILSDKFTSSYLARENQQYCRRARKCHTRCLSGTPCAPDDPKAPKPIYRCWNPQDPQFATPTGPQLPLIDVEAQLDLMYPRCGPSACSAQATYIDHDFDDKQCRPYAYPASEESGEFCWNPGDPPPPDRDGRCDDGWKFSIELTPDWKFHAIPFSQFAQAAFGKRAPYMDLKSLATIAFGAPMGYADFFIDNVTFYRRAK
jgi:hypothetical protein